MYLKKYIKDYFLFKKKGGKIKNIYISLENFKNEAFEFKNQFFHSDLLISQKIFENNPKTLASIIAVIIGILSKNIIATIVAGLAVYWFLIFI